MKIHPLADCYPLEPDVVAKIADSMREHGFDAAHPIVVTHQIGTASIVDGRTRYAAALVAGVKPVFKSMAFTSDTKVDAFIQRANDARRGNMTRYQRLAHAIKRADVLGLPRPLDGDYKSLGFASVPEMRRALRVFSEGGEQHERCWLHRAGVPAAPRRTPAKRAESATTPAAAPATTATTDVPASQYQPVLFDFASAADRLLLETGEGTDAEQAEALKRTRERAAVGGWAPDYGWNHPVPAPHIAQGVSSMRRVTYPDGTTGIQWVKSSLSDARAREVMQIALDEFLRPLKGLGELPTAPENADGAGRLNVFVLGDPHFGMLAWAKETLGPNYDLDIAERVHVEGMRRLVDGAPPAEQALIINLGDALHADNYNFLTQSGHRLDADGRFPKAVRVAVNSFRTMGQFAAAKHQRTLWWNVSGNHDRNIVPWLTEALRGYWSHCPQIEVETSPASNLCFRFDKVLIVGTHGDRIKGKFTKKRLSAQDLLSVAANDWPEDWGVARHRYAFQGHIHSSNTIEASGGTLESFQTMSPNDAWHGAQLYRSGKSMTRITYDAEHGEIGRGRVPASMVRVPESP